MNIVKRKISSKYRIFDKDTNIVIMNSVECVVRYKKYTEIKEIDITEIEISNIPIGLYVNCVKNNYSILFTDFENYKIFKFSNNAIATNELQDVNFLILLKYIIENKNKFENIN